MGLSLFALSFLLTTTLAVPLDSLVTHEKRNIDSKIWAKRDAVPRDMVLPMRIGLVQGNLESGHDLLMSLSDPSSERYGKHFSAEEVAELFAPRESTVGSVRQWLEASGVSADRISQSANKGWLQFDAPAAEAERLLSTSFHYFEHETTGDLNVACDSYFVPQAVQQHIDYITPGTKLIATGNGRKRAATNGLKRRGFGAPPIKPVIKPIPENLSNPYTFGVDDVSRCDQSVTPACIRAAYNITLGTKASSGNQLGIYETGDFYSQGDLNDFYAKAFPTIKSGFGPKLDSIDGGKAPVSQENAGVESNLDFELALPIIYPQSAVLFQVDDTPYSEGFSKQGLFNNFLDAIDGSYCTYKYKNETGNDAAYDYTYPDKQDGGYTGQLQCGVYKPTNVISVSYGVNEADYSPVYQQRQCQEWMKLGLQGVSVVFASGDSGVGGRPGQNGHQNGCLKDGTVFNPDYPGTCPYITMVGSTYIPPGVNAHAHGEVATNSFSSGGGFSNLYSTPSYQAQAVSAYLKTNAPATVKAYKSYSVKNGDAIGAKGGIYNRDGRGYPDVAALGDNIYIVSNGYAGLAGGTSASAPIFASILTRINEERLAAGKSTVGFVNPLLYQHPEVFYDITSGDNEACSSKGFIASKGWDPVTGLGTPNYSAMLSLFMAQK